MCWWWRMKGGISDTIFHFKNIQEEEDDDEGDREGSQ